MTSIARKYFRIVILCGSVLMLIFSCDLLTPDRFEEGTGKIGSIDAIACDLLSRELIQLDTLYTGTDTVPVIDTLYTMTTAISDSLTLVLDSLLISTSAGSQELVNLIGVLASELETLAADTTVMLELEGSGASNFYCLYQAGSDLDLTSYVSWAFNRSNVNNYVGIDIIDMQGDMLEISNLDMPLEAISGCMTEYVADEETGSIDFTPVLKNRVEFSLEAGTYLFRLNLTEFINSSGREPILLALLEDD